MAPLTVIAPARDLLGEGILSMASTHVPLPESGAIASRLGVDPQTVEDKLNDLQMDGVLLNFGDRILLNTRHGIPAQRRG